MPPDEDRNRRGGRSVGRKDVVQRDAIEAVHAGEHQRVERCGSHSRCSCGKGAELDVHRGEAEGRRRILAALAAQPGSKEGSTSLGLRERGR